MGKVCFGESFYLVQLITSRPFLISKSAEQSRDTNQSMEFEIFTQFRQKTTVLTFKYSKCQTKLSPGYCKQGLGGTVIQRQGNHLRLVAYVSKAWTETECRCAEAEKGSQPVLYARKETC